VSLPVQSASMANITYNTHEMVHNNNQSLKEKSCTDVDLVCFHQHKTRDVDKVGWCTKSMCPDQIVTACTLIDHK